MNTVATEVMMNTAAEIAAKPSEKTIIVAGKEVPVSEVLKAAMKIVAANTNEPATQQQIDKARLVMKFALLRNDQNFLQNGLRLGVTMGVSAVLLSSTVLAGKMLAEMAITKITELTK